MTPGDTQDRFCLCLTGQIHGTKGACLNGAKWPPYHNITIKFLDGDRSLQQRVQSCAMRWLDYAKTIDFVFQNSGNTDIRIAFQQGAGSWSHLGTQCRNIPQDQPTMNFGWLTPGSTDLEIQRVVLHEFGHALGLIHEHQIPGAIQWNRDAVIGDLSKPPFNWSEKTIDTNMFHTNAMSDLTATAIDKESIMLYMIPGRWTTNGFYSRQNDDLSKTDKEFIRTIYGQ